MKPKILAVKLGYNPNSSSIGILLKIFFYNAMAVSIIFSSLGLLLSFKHRKKPALNESGQQQEPVNERSL